MIACLPSTPGKACVRRIDWMISLSLRSIVRSGSCTRSSGSRTLRTSCWVTVEAPRLSPRMESSPAATIASGSKPAFSQNVLSSIAVVGVDDDRRDVVELDDLALDVAEPCELDLARPVVDDRLLVRLEGRQLVRVGQAGRERGVHADRADGADDPDAGEEAEDDERDPADGGRRGPTGAVRAAGRRARDGAGGSGQLGLRERAEGQASGVRMPRTACGRC